MKSVLSLSRVRLASTAGPIIIVEPGVPTEIPKALYIEAARNGCVDYNPAMVEAFRKAIQAPGVEKPKVDSAALVKQAVRHVMIAAVDTPELLTSQGAPRLPAVRAALEQLTADAGTNVDIKLTSEVVADFTAMVNAESQPTPAKPARAPATPPQGDLEGEEVGGDLDAILARVGDAEE